jgi:cystathionine beta-lyase/cystathionine gamma-synthase
MERLIEEADSTVGATVADPDFDARAETIHSDKYPIERLVEDFECSKDQISRWRRQFPRDEIVQLHAGVGKASTRIRALLQAWRDGKLMFDLPSADSQDDLQLPFLSTAKTKATRAGYRFLEDVGLLLTSSTTARYSMDEVFVRWRWDLSMMVGRILNQDNRWTPARDEIAALFVALPRRPRTSGPSDGPGRRRLHRQAEQWGRSQGRRSLPKYTRLQALWDSYWTMGLFIDEIHQYRAQIAELAERDGLDERIKLLSPETGQRVLRELNFLLALVELRRGIDVLRFLLLERRAIRRYVPFEVDADLRWAFEQILQGIPLSVGMTPDRGTRDYARSEHIAREVVVERYAAMHSLPRSSRAKYVPASSAMAILSDVLLLASGTSARTRQRRTAVIGLVGRTYFETREVLARLLSLATRTARVVTASLDTKATARRLDALVVEPIENHPDGTARSLAGLRRLVSKLRPGIVVIDVTLDPLVLRRLTRFIPPQTVCVVVDSLTKYAQAGSNVAIGGIATVIPGKSSGARKRAQSMVDWLHTMNRLLGQHMDPRLAITLVPSREVLEERLRRMRRNAKLVADVFRRIVPDRVHHARHGRTVSTLVYLVCTINWRATAVEPLMRFRRWPKGAARTTALLRGIESDFIRPVGEGEREAAILRLSTSFGFNATSAHSLVHPQATGDDFWVRVSAGMESVEHLDSVIRFRLGEWLPFLTSKWEDYHLEGAWPRLIGRDD